MHLATTKETPGPPFKASIEAAFFTVSSTWMDTSNTKPPLFFVLFWMGSRHSGVFVAGKLPQKTGMVSSAHAI